MGKALIQDCPVENWLMKCASDYSIIKLWDLRKIHTRRKNPPFVENNEEAVAELTTARPHGISSMVISPDGRRLYALSTDSR